MTISECQEGLTNYVDQMTLPENSVKLDVLEYLHRQAGRYLAAWRILKNKESEAAAAALKTEPAQAEPGATPRR